MKLMIDSTDPQFMDVVRLLSTWGQGAEDGVIFRSVAPAPADPLPSHPTPNLAFATGDANPVKLEPEDRRIELDAEGLPYDTRIHSASREKNKDGTWRIRRNSDPEKVKAVKEELKKLMAAPTVIVTADPPESISVQSVTVVPVEPPPVVAPPPPAPAATEPPPPPPVGDDAFVRLMRHITDLGKAGKLNIKRAIELGDGYATSLGVEPNHTLIFLHQRQDLIPGFRAVIDKEVGV